MTVDLIFNMFAYYFNSTIIVIILGFLCFRFKKENILTNCIIKTLAFIMCFDYNA